MNVLPPRSDTQQPDTALVDLDGTLVDSNYQHALAWYRTFRRIGLVIPAWQIHRHIGMGGDQLVAALAGDPIEARHGDRLRAAWREEFEPMLPEIAPLPYARETLVEIRRRGYRLALATSGEQDHIDHHLDLLDARSLVQGWTTSGDVAATKPAPDLLESALEKVGGARPVVVGDSTWDCRAAGQIGAPCVAILTGGFSEQELREAGAACVFGSLKEFLDRFDETPFVVH
jgi:HAD superfamily hydrolase (TIGR01549 family)